MLRQEFWKFTVWMNLVTLLRRVGCQSWISWAVHPHIPECRLCRFGREVEMASFVEDCLGSAWMSGEEQKKGMIVTGQLADMAVLSQDYFAVPEPEIKSLQSVLTIVGGKIVYSSESFAQLGPKPLPVSPDWSPVARKR